MSTKGLSTFYGIPATGAIARTAVNIRAGAKTRASGVVHSVTIALVLVALAPLAAQIPLAVLAGLLLGVSVRMIEWDQIRLVMRATCSDVVVLLVTWATTVLFDLDRPLFFDDAQRFADTLHPLPDRHAVVLCMDSVTTLDVTAALALGETLADLRRRGVAIALCGLQPPVSDLLTRLSLLPAEVDVQRYAHVDDAVAALGGGRMAA